MKPDTYISFYLQSSKIRVFQKALRAIGDPDYICFMFNEEKKKMIVRSYTKKDFYSHRVHKNNNVAGKMEVRSLPFCNLLMSELNWEMGKSYRAPGTVYPEIRLIEYDLAEAQEIEELTDTRTF